jgi:hypothetical protein
LTPRVIANGDSVICIWSNGFRIGPLRYNLGHSTSYDAGLTWAGPEYVLEEGWLSMGAFVATGTDSLINIIVGRQDDSNWVFYSIRSADFATTWSEPNEIFGVAFCGIPDQAQFKEMIYFLWAGGFEQQAEGDVYCITSSDYGITWSNNILLSTIDAYPSQRPAAAADSGKAAVSWWDFKSSPYWFSGDIFIRQSLDSCQNWMEEMQLSFNHFATRSDIVISGDTLIVAWQDQSQGTSHRIIYYIKSEDGGITWSEPYSIDGTEDDSWDPAIATSNGRVYAIWYDERGGPDSMGLYFTRYDPEPDAIGEDR